MNDVLPLTVGFELEWWAEGGALVRVAEALSHTGYEVTNYGRYRHTPPSTTSWDLKTDSSCGPCDGVVGYEAVSPVISTYSQLVTATKVADTIRRCGGSVTPRCGLHVHVGFQRYNNSEIRDRLFRFLARYEEAFYMLAPATRRSNRYCKPMNQCVIDSIKHHKGNVDLCRVWADKNTWVNCATLSRIGTIEFRFMEGTLDSNLILNYVTFLVHVMDTIIGGKKVSWGRAKAVDARMLFFTMLQQLNLYGKKSKVQDEDRAKMVRKWCTTRFAKLNPNPHQPRVEFTNRAQDRPDLTEDDLANMQEVREVNYQAPEGGSHGH